MSVTDSTQLGDRVSVGITMSMSAPKVRAHLSDSGGEVVLLVGDVCLILRPADAASVAASLATVASTALVNNTLKLVTE